MDPLLLWVGGLQGGTLCERVSEAFRVRVVVQKMLLFEGFGFVCFHNNRRQTKQFLNSKMNPNFEAPGGWEFFILGLLLFWAIKLKLS